MRRLAPILTVGSLVLAASAPAVGLQTQRARPPRPLPMQDPVLPAVPLPVARPHFPSDDAVPRQTVPPPLAAPASPPPAQASTRPETPPGADTGCFEALKRAGVTFEAVTLGPQPNPLCTIAMPVRLASLRAADGATIALPDKPTVACITGTVFADFVRTLLSPLAKGSYGSAVGTVTTGPGFDCRTRDHIPGAKISAHGQGLAIDIAEIVLADGRKIEVGTARTEPDRMFDRAARAGACGFFHTALGPDADSFHETHWHFDLEPRGSHGDSRICQ